MQKRRREPAPVLARDFSAEELSKLTGAHISTARRWRQFGTLPPVIARAIALVRNADLASVHPEWSGWRINERGEIVSPEGWTFSAGDLRATRVLERNGLHATHNFEAERAQLAAERAAVLSSEERAENVNTLVRLDRWAKRIRKEIRRATERLHPAEQEQVWREATRAQRVRAERDAAEIALDALPTHAPAPLHAERQRLKRSGRLVVVPDYIVPPHPPAMMEGRRTHRAGLAAGVGVAWLREAYRATPWLRGLVEPAGIFYGL